MSRSLKIRIEQGLTGSFFTGMPKFSTHSISESGLDIFFLKMLSASHTMVDGSQKGVTIALSNAHYGIIIDYQSFKFTDE